MRPAGGFLDFCENQAGGCGKEVHPGLAAIT